MSKRLKTKYYDFISEETLYIKNDLHVTLGEMAKTNVVASLLVMVADYYKMYNDDSQVNFISFSDEINMLQYVPVNKRDSSKDMFSSPDITKVAMRIGRLVKKIIADIDKSSAKFTYTGKAIVSTERPIFNERIEKDLTTLFFISNKTGEDFSTKWQRDEFMMGFDDKESVGSTQDMCGTRVSLKVDGKEYKTRVFQFDDNSYNSRWEKDIVYFKLQFTDNLGIGATGSIKDTSRRGYQLKDSDPLDIDMELDLTFDDKLVGEINDSDIEKFVNELIANIKVMRAPEGSIIEVVSGEEIRKWYDSSNYLKMVGQLGGSCMGHKECQPYLNIYTENPEVVSLLILRGGDKLIGRALLWKLDSGKYFMDRVYCTSEYDEKIFIKYAIEKGYYYRYNGSNHNIKYYLEGKEIPIPSDLIVTLTNSHFDYYPYMDTLKDLDEDGAVLHYENPDIPIDKELRDTGGKWTGYESDEEENYEED